MSCRLSLANTIHKQCISSPACSHLLRQVRRRGTVLVTLPSLPRWRWSSSNAPRLSVQLDG